MVEAIKLKIVVPRKSDLEIAFKSIPGHKNHKNLKLWEFPAIFLFDLAKAVEFLHPKLFSHLMNNSVFAQHRLEANKAMTSTADSRKSTSTLKVPAPEGKKYKEYQLACVEYAIKRKCKGALVADDMGLGKTIETLAIYNYLNWKSKGNFRDMLIVCPSSVKYNWFKEACDWVVDAGVEIRVLTGAKSPAGFEPGGICIINYDILYGWYHALGIEWDMFVADESTYFKNPKAKRTIAGLLLAEMSSWRFGLSGTPIEKCPAELWTTIHMVDPVSWGNESRFMHRYCEPKQNYFSGEIEYKGASNVAELGVKLRETCMIRRVKSDVAKELPPKIIQTVAFDLPGKTTSADVAREMARYQEAKAKGLSLESLAAAFEHDSSWAALRQKTALAKLPLCLDFIETLLMSTPKVVVFAHHKIIQEKIAAYFKGRCCLGRMAGTALQRQAQVDKFNTKSFQGVFVGSIRGDRTGINLQTAEVSAFVEQDPVPAVMEQAEDRIHRQGQLGNVVIYNLVLRDSLDEELANTRKNRESVNKLAMA